MVEAGGYAQAAEAMHKSQSTITYAVQKIESLLDVKVFEIRGRKAVLTEAGQVLYRRARTLLEEATMLERGAAQMSQEWQPEIRLAVEMIFPTWLLLESLEEFARERPETRIEIYETVLSGTGEMLAGGPRGHRHRVGLRRGDGRAAHADALHRGGEPDASAAPSGPARDGSRPCGATAASSSATRARSARARWPAWSCAGP